MLFMMSALYVVLHKVGAGIVRLDENIQIMHVSVAKISVEYLGFRAHVTDIEGIAKCKALLNIYYVYL